MKGWSSPLLLLLLFSAALAADASPKANSECTQVLRRPFDGGGVAQLVDKNRKSLLEGHRLPTNYTLGYYARRIEPNLSKPNFPEVKNPDVLYRGMFVSMDELLSLLREGQKFNKVTWTAVGGEGIYFSSNITEAQNYIFMNADARAEGIGVVVKVVKKDYMIPLEKSVNNPTSTIFKSPQDVPPQDYLEVYLWGEYGLENLQDVLKKVQEGTIKPHSGWTGVFDSLR